MSTPGTFPMAPKVPTPDSAWPLHLQIGDTKITVVSVTLEHTFSSHDQLVAKLRDMGVRLLDHHREREALFVEMAHGTLQGAALNLAARSATQFSPTATTYFVTPIAQVAS